MSVIISRFGKVRNCTGRIVCEPALWGAMAAGREKEGELATTSLEFQHFAWTFSIQIFKCKLFLWFNFSRNKIPANKRKVILLTFTGKNAHARFCETKELKGENNSVLHSLFSFPRQ